MSARAGTTTSITLFALLSTVLSAVLSALLIAPLGAAEPLAAGSTRTSTNATLGLTVVATDVNLPLGRWDAVAITPAKVLEQVFVVPAGVPVAAGGRRVQISEIDKQVEAGRWRVQAFFGALRDYAATHGGVGPNTFRDVDAKKFSYLLQGLDRSPWPDDAGKSVQGPFYFLIPGVPISTAPGGRAPAPATPLVLELRPYVDDGKHWVLFADGRAERLPIDVALVAKHNLTLSFVRAKGRPVETPAGAAPAVRHIVLGLLRSPSASSAIVTLAEASTGRRTDVRWNLGGAQPDASMLALWAQARARDWAPLADQGDAAVLRAWTARSRDLYGTAPAVASPEVRAMREAPRTTDVFSFLGGRAALRETLQTELLRTGPAGAPEPATIPISTLRGVEVKALPFDEMLGGKEGGRIALADHVPADRFFVYFAKPSAVFPFLDHGGNFLFRAGSLFTKSAIDDDLKSRYLRRLGLGENQGRRFLESGDVVDLAFVAPDLFFIDGTELTVLMRLRAPDKIVATLRLLGIVDLKGDGVTEKPLASGRSAYWARQGDLLSVSTSRAELDAMLALGPRQGAGSLGRSAELRYLLTQLPLKKETRAVAYLSDPFIRRMVGPAMKIAQLRRMRARADMEIITAGALLSKLDGNKDTPDLDTLMKLGYVPRSAAGGGYRLRDDFSVVSWLWGTPAELAGIDTAAIDKVTPSEARAYQGYVDEYSRYWRQYFDPIAMRIDDAPGGALEVSTFILPLLDSQVYNQLRGFIAVRENGPALRVPAVTPDPVLMLSLNLTDDAWVKISGSWSQLFSQYTGIDPGVFDRLGPGLHIAVQDADPVIALGNADLLGAFGGAALTAGVPGQGLMFPFLLSVLTRPCKIFVELQDAPATLELLRRATKGAQSGRGVLVEFRQVGGKDAWIYALNLPGIAKIRFGIEVQNGYLILSNIPWSQPVTLKTVPPRDLNGAAVQVAPGAVKQGLSGLFATQSEQNQLASIKGMAALYPLLATLGATPEAAAARHAGLFGSKPVHPGSGTWVWKDGKIESSAYGSATHWKEPLYRPEMGDFGLFEGVTELAVNMQLESGGLRAVARWLWKGK